MPEIAFDYIPRAQFVDFHNRSERWACLVAHRRGGKTVACIQELITRASYTQKQDARYAYVCPFYRQAKDVAWQYLKNFSEGVATKTRESSLRVELFNGAWITLYGADNPDALRGLYFDGVILDEYGDSRPSLWGTVILPTLVDRRGWAVFIGTPKCKNHFYEVYQRAQVEVGWYSMTLKASSSNIIAPDELLEMKAQMGEDEYNQEMECDFTAAVKGTYYATIIAQMEVSKAITSVPHDPARKVNVAMDIGRVDATTAWFWQDSPTGPNIIDYEEHEGKDVDFFADLFRSKPYDYEAIWVPHDAKAKTFATKRSTIEQFIAHEFPMMQVPKLAINHGIQAVRRILPRCRIDAIHCKDGIEALRAYKKRYNELTKAFSDAPQHDWASNGADGFRYLSLVCQESEKEDVIEVAQVPMVKPPEYRLDDLWKDREKGKSRYQTLRIH